jgi:phosphate/sulfate permease
MGSSSTMKIIGLVLLIVGIGLAFWGYQISESVGSQITQTVTGSYTDKVMLLFIGGAASFIAGLFLFIKK